jgi:hypothetical protein
MSMSHVLSYSAFLTILLFDIVHKASLNKAGIQKHHKHQVSTDLFVYQGKKVLYTVYVTCKFYIFE